ncbi:MAG UNVERIFIED_CONTAM: hypothetical protein LVR18_00480 [Planctomycetaceae bacterium]
MTDRALGITALDSPATESRPAANNCGKLSPGKNAPRPVRAAAVESHRRQLAFGRKLSAW